MFTILHYDSLESTNEQAKLLLRTNKILPHTLVIATEQTKGKGQQGHEWQSEKGKNITCSIVCDIQFLQPQDFFSLINCAAIACHQYVCKKLNTNTDGLTIKWVNDILFNKKKLAGILIENIFSPQQVRYSIIGIGINLNQISFPANIVHKATSLRGLTKQEKEYDIMEESILLLKEFEQCFSVLQTRPEDLLVTYNGLLFNRNQEQLFLSNDGYVKAKILYAKSDGSLAIAINGTKTQIVFREMEWIIVD